MVHHEKIRTSISWRQTNKMRFWGHYGLQSASEGRSDLIFESEDMHGKSDSSPLTVKMTVLAPVHGKSHVNTSVICLNNLLNKLSFVCIVQGYRSRGNRKTSCMHTAGLSQHYMRVIQYPTNNKCFQEWHGSLNKGCSF